MIPTWMVYSGRLEYVTVYAGGIAYSLPKDVYLSADKYGMILESPPHMIELKIDGVDYSDNTELIGALIAFMYSAVVPRIPSALMRAEWSDRIEDLPGMLAAVSYARQFADSDLEREYRDHVMSIIRDAVDDVRALINPCDYHTTIDILGRRLPGLNVRSGVDRVDTLVREIRLYVHGNPTCMSVRGFALECTLTVCRMMSVEDRALHGVQDITDVLRGGLGVLWT